MKIKIKFQFLIGWLQTSYCLHYLPQDSFVSIPYRLATNSGSSEYGRSQTPEFQFLIGWLQTGHCMSVPRMYQKCFNSLQVGYKHGKTISVPAHDLSFNSLQVGYKPIPTRTKLLPSFLFQFLIGWLQTFWFCFFCLCFQHGFNSLQVGYKLKRKITIF